MGGEAVSGWSDEKRIDVTIRLKSLWEHGLCDKEIAKALGISVQTVRKIRWAEDLELNDGRILSPEREAERRRCYDDGLSDIEIARRQGVSSSSILLWRRRNGLPAHIAKKKVPS